jgi:hypothetical protein
VARKDTIEKELTEEAIKKGLVRDFCNKEIYVINFLKKLL